MIPQQTRNRDLSKTGHSWSSAQSQLNALDTLKTSETFMEKRFYAPSLIFNACAEQSYSQWTICIV